MATYTMTADGQYLLNPAPGVNGPDGVVVSFVISGTNSGVLKINSAPPGAAVSLVSVPYLNASLALQSAGTAVTATGLAYVSAADASRGDLYLDLNWTSGSVVADVMTASIGGGGSSGGTVPAADVTAGTFGANTGETGDYTFPDDLVVSDDADVVGDLTAGTIASDAGVSGTTGAFTTSVTVTSASASALAVGLAGATNPAFKVDSSTASQAAGLSVIGAVAAGTVTVAVMSSGADAGLAINAKGTGSLSLGASATGAVNLAQNTASGTTTVGSSTASGANTLRINGAAGQLRDFHWTTAGNARWIGRANATAESGSDAGSDFELLARTDAGAAIDSPLTVVRATGGALYTAAGRPVAQGGAPGAALTRTKVLGSAAAIADNVATTIATITVPNIAATATIRLTAQGALGAGGAIGAREAMASNSWNIVLARTAGVNVVAQISAAYGADAANVAGAATCTAVVTLGAVAGAVGATNTVPVQITIVKSGGASDNHTASWEAVVLNAAAGGVTIA